MKYKLIKRSNPLLLFAFLGILNLTSFAQTKKNVLGIWEVSQITIEKNTDGKTEKNVYNKGGKVQSYIPCPQKWEIKDSKTIVLYYEDGTEETSEYEIKDNQLAIRYAGAILSYRYIVNDDTLTLTITHKYKWNLPDGSLQDREEKWNITLKKHNNNLLLP